MAKSGFSVSQRRKVQNISGDGPLAITAADCGTMFVITDDSASLTASRAISLPDPAVAGNGWHCKIVLGVAQDNGGEDTVITAPENFASQLMVTADGAAATAIVATNATTITIDVSASDVAGDQVEFMVLNGAYHATAHMAT